MNLLQGSFPDDNWLSSKFNQLTFFARFSANLSSFFFISFLFFLENQHHHKTLNNSALSKHHMRKLCNRSLTRLIALNTTFKMGGALFICVIQLLSYCSYSQGTNTEWVWYFIGLWIVFIVALALFNLTSHCPSLVGSVDYTDACTVHYCVSK